ncbi:MAG: cupin domain-containing protein [Caldilineaceae bacterium]
MYALADHPACGRAKAHLHENHETAIYVISGKGGMWYGEQLEEHMVCKAGDYVYIPAGVPHLPYNTSATEVCTAVVARTDPNEQESVVLRPDLDGLH